MQPLLLVFLSVIVNVIPNAVNCSDAVPLSTPLSTNAATLRSAALCCSATVDPLIITAPVPEKKGLPYETIESWTGIDQLDRLDAQHALVVRRAEGGSLNLESLPLP